nr:DUF1854 domain-containing protein [Paenibacillus sp. ACRRX]
MSLTRSIGGILSGCIEGRAYDELILYRTFPVTDPDHYVSVRDGNGIELGIIVEPQELDEESRFELAKEMRLRYFMPHVTCIQSVRYIHEMWIWQLVTDAGPLRLIMPNLHEHMQMHGASRLLLTDAQGRQCEIANMDELGPSSKKWLADVL